MQPLPIKSSRIASFDGMGLSSERVLDGNRRSPSAGITLVSSDSHLFIAEDIFHDHAPNAVKARMPRIWKENGFFQMGVGFNTLFKSEFDTILASLDRPGAYDLNARLGDMDDDGIAMEIAFPQWLMYYLHHPDLEARGWIFRIYNEYLADIQARSQGRVFGVGIPNYWDPSKAAPSIEHIASLGLKTFLVPINPANDASGRRIEYASAEMAPFWAAAAASGLPVNFHVGENSNTLAGPGGIGTTVLETFTPFRKSLGQLIFGGIFDRHPTLRVVFSEAGINWVPAALQDAEAAVDGWGKLMTPRIKARPTEYWRQHCYATFMSDPIGLKLIDYLGADKAMWSTDYPHNEGIHGRVPDVVNQVFAAMPRDQALDVLGGTAIALYDLPHPDKSIPLHS